MRMNCNLIYVLRHQYFIDMVKYCNKFGGGPFWVDNFGWMDSFCMDLVFGTGLGVLFGLTIEDGTRAVVLIIITSIFYSIFTITLRNLKRKY